MLLKRSRKGAQEIDSIETSVYLTIGRVFHDFIKGKGFNDKEVGKLIQALNGYLISGRLDSNLYDYYIEILEDVTAFCKP